MSTAPRLAVRLRHGLAIAVVSLQAGCVSAPPPADFDLRHTEMVIADVPARVDVNGLPGGKPMGAGVGVGTGLGGGLLLGAAACAATGPFIGICVAAILPATSVAGAVTGGVVGVVRTETVEALQRKTRALEAELAASAYQERLARRLQEELRVVHAVQVPLAADSRAAGSPASDEGAEPKPWTLEVALSEVGTEGKSEFALRLVTRIALRRTDQAMPVWTIAKEVQSETELTTSAWLLAGAAAMRVVLDRCLRQAAHELAVDLTRPGSGPTASSHPRSPRSSSCQDVPNDVIKATAS